MEIGEIQLYSSGTASTVKDAIKWIGYKKVMKPKSVTTNSNRDTKEAVGETVHDAVIADKTRNIIISIWEELVELQADQYYVISHMITKSYSRLKFTTTQHSKTKDFESEKITDWHTIPVEEYMSDITQHLAKQSFECGRKDNIVPN